MERRPGGKDPEITNVSLRADTADASWGGVLRQYVVHPRFSWLMQFGGLPPPGANSRSAKSKLYHKGLGMLFICCLIVCTSRMIVRSRPAFYNVRSAFVLCHTPLSLSIKY